MIGQFGKARVNPKFKCNVFKATMQVALLTGLCAFAGQNESFTEGDLNQLEACQKRLCEAPRCDDEEKFWTLSQKGDRFRPTNCIESW